MNALTRQIVLLLALMLVAGTPSTAGAPPARAAPQLSTRTHIFYYPWYQNPEFSGFYRHWQERTQHSRSESRTNCFAQRPGDVHALHLLRYARFRIRQAQERHTTRLEWTNHADALNKILCTACD